MLQVIDPALSHEDVVSTLHTVGAEQALNEHQMITWCDVMFGDLDDDQYVHQLIELASAAELAMSVET